ncbi:MAG: acyltransferase family protein [Pseudolabrys sp.]|nr:acyltransferase family protein [Pseudolabrys sp.]MDP2297658.1 acyltransferase family protein [Pseudolabrys sp.]
MQHSEVVGRQETRNEIRIDWVDYAKGFCIIFVVMMHSTLGVEAASGREGWLHAVVDFARPFRMPDFFMISGLFLAQVIDRDWRTYIDRKVVHFVYFYLLWMTIQFAFKAPGIAAESGLIEVARLYLVSLIDPFGTLWFIYLLPIFFVVVKLLRRVPVAVVWLAAAALEISQLNTGWMVPDEFAARFVYFYTGYIAARYVFTLAADAQANTPIAIGGLLVWALFNGLMVREGLAALPFVSLGMGLLGAAAVATLSALLARHGVFKPLRYCGRNSIVIYLAFFLPMAVSRAVLLKTGVITDIGTISVIVTACGVLGSLAMFWAARAVGANFLFERPAMFWLVPDKAKPAPRPVMQPAE